MTDHREHDHIELPNTITLYPWHAGAMPYGRGLERFWAPIIGPSASCIWRQLVHELTEEPDTVSVVISPAKIGEWYGLRNGLLTKAFDRLARFNLIHWHDDQWCDVRLQVPALGPFYEERLPEAIRAAYLDYVDAASTAAR